MTDTTSTSRVTVMQLILIPSLITLAVTLLRLIGELQHWPTRLFNPEAGGFGSIVGITWLAPIFGIYFALKLAKSGQGPERPGRAILFGVAGIAVVILVSVIAFALKANQYGQLIAFFISFVLAALVQYPAWPALFKVLAAYAFAARIPVAILMFFAMKGDWHTHYDVVPPDMPPEMSQFWTKYIWLAFLPQIFGWTGFTVWAGSLFGSIATAISKRGEKSELRATSAQA